MSFLSRSLRQARPLVCSSGSTAAAAFLNPRVPISFYSTWREELAHKWKDQAEIDEARQWLANFKPSDIPRKQLHPTFSTASGPGGQNVNKAATKATLHFDLEKLAPTFLPSIVIRKIKENSRHNTKNDEIVIQVDESRRQHDNVEKCYEQLYKIIRASVMHDLPGETTPEKHKHVMELQKAEREDRKRIKMAQSAKKQSRRGKGSDLD